MRLVIIGSGNVATVLGDRFIAAGHQIVQVLGRNEDPVNELGLKWNAKPSINLTDVHQGADFYLLAVSDGAVKEIAERLKPVNGIIAHTAGSVETSGELGVFYPLQSLRKELSYVDPIPILVNAKTEQTMSVLEQLAYSISTMVSRCDDDRRAGLHLAATIVNNFTNHLFSQAYDFCREQDLPFEMLVPLMKRTVESAAVGDPAAVQTGPAARRDFTTIKKHLALLRDRPDLAELYSLLSDSILGR